ncbi:TPA: hypothetical protein KOS69_003918 [Clostridioides difficile]|uniref:hypothetical protein n=2 Tax=Clostridioides difficile TaxID=1496 RepID=UPI0009800A3E|nr:hypothetical protein [Clostridioides difficile]ELX4591903.1 hypothetical protein [Clostridioides difficile]MBG0257657.1 hypothetical protein [Clostridioides difficile]MBH7538599.1 hypothetical protein [Clostridioides difficile]MBY1607247.1 hypothetical protein [Clostridioides difficile]MBZ0645494.1 hypothetical protein [Clostridioides difficile]
MFTEYKNLKDKMLRVRVTDRQKKIVEEYANLIGESTSSYILSLIEKDLLNNKDLFDKAEKIVDDKLL